MGENKKPTREEIELRAYEIYLARGADGGSEIEDWLEAERQLTGDNLESLSELPEVGPQSSQPMRARKATAS
jgi:hypothetical protein